MKYILLLLVLLNTHLLAQEGKTDPKVPDQNTAETEEQKAIRSVSIRDLEEADAQLNAEREAIAKRARRLELLVEDLNNQTQAVDTKHQAIRTMLESLQQDKLDDQVDATQVAHWESRNPVVAAEDFVILFREEPKVAIGIVKHMKKKKGARLVDEVSKLGNNGKKIAASLHEAIGTGLLKTEN